tara:strand:- start:1339 stop:1620 length:282 start_codon:yes stop_codon:yes gene_type:complete
MKYLFTQENSNFNNLELTDPTIEIVGLSIGNPDIIKIDFNTLRYSLNVLLITPSSKFGLLLGNVQSESLNFESEGAKMPAQVLKALNEQFGVL